MATKRRDFLTACAVTAAAAGLDTGRAGVITFAQAKYSSAGLNALAGV